MNPFPVLKNKSDRLTLPIEQKSVIRHSRLVTVPCACTFTALFPSQTFGFIQVRTVNQVTPSAMGMLLFLLSGQPRAILGDPGEELCLGVPCL